MRIRTVIGLALVGLCQMLTPPTAHADNANFVSEAKGLGFVQSSPNLISTARSACYFLYLNRDPGQVRDRVSRYLMVDVDLADKFLAMSVLEYCPQYRDRVGA